MYSQMSDEPMEGIPFELKEEEHYALYRRGYDIGYQLNAGSYGQVFKAKHYDENIACKTILLNPRRIGRVFYVIDELTILKKLSGHPNISNLIDFHMLSSRHLLIFMELITGGDVRDQLHDMFPDGFSEQVGRNLFRGIANGLHYIHNLGIAHLDLKPENIMLSHKDLNLAIAKITDFGLSKECYFLETGLPGELGFEAHGTMTYMSPEVLKVVINLESETGRVFRDTIYCPFAADVFSAGVLLYEMLHGNDALPNKLHLYVENVNLVEPTYMHQRWMENESQYDFHPKLSDSCCDLIKRMLFMIPERRIIMDYVMQHRWVLPVPV